MNLQEINDRFNHYLEKQISGTLSKGYVYSLGFPNNTLLSAGVPLLPIEISSRILSIKSSPSYGHPFDLVCLKDFPLNFMNPILIFDSKTKENSITVLMDIQYKECNFLGALKLNTIPKNKKKITKINDIRSIYPKDNIQDIINWINTGYINPQEKKLLKFSDKEKTLKWLTQQQSNSAEVANSLKGIISATKVIQNFENPKIYEAKPKIKIAPPKKRGPRL